MVASMHAYVELGMKSGKQTIYFAENLMSHIYLKA